MNAIKRASRGEQSSSGCGRENVDSGGTGIIGQMRAYFQTLLVQITPLGYQDENGFHYGAEPCYCEKKAVQSEKRDFVI
jgi:hypothetical protein